MMCWFGLNTGCSPDLAFQGSVVPSRALFFPLAAQEGISRKLRSTGVWTALPQGYGRLRFGAKGLRLVTDLNVAHSSLGVS